MAVVDGQDQAKAAGLSPNLLDILVCPVDKQDLRFEGSQLVCTKCGHTYPIVDGIPNMMPPEDQ